MYLCAGVSILPLPTIFYWILEFFRHCGMFCFSIFLHMITVKDERKVTLYDPNGEVVRSWGIGKEKKRYNKTSNFIKGLNGYGV